MKVPTSSSLLSAITWKRVLIALLLVLMASYAVNLKINNLRREKDLRGLEADKQARLDNKEAYLKEIKKAYQDSIEIRDLELSRIDVQLDSFDIALTLKDIQLKDIEHEVDKMRGDSIGIANTLTRILSR